MTLTQDSVCFDSVRTLPCICASDDNIKGLLGACFSFEIKCVPCIVIHRPDAPQAGPECYCLRDVPEEPKALWRFDERLLEN